MAAKVARLICSSTLTAPRLPASGSVLIAETMKAGSPPCRIRMPVPLSLRRASSNVGIAARNEAMTVIQVIVPAIAVWLFRTARVRDGVKPMITIATARQTICVPIPAAIIAKCHRADVGCRFRMLLPKVKMFSSPGRIGVLR